MTEPDSEPDPMAGISVFGLIETRYRKWVGDLAPLSVRQEAIAEQIFRLASLLDKEEGGAQAAALSREIRIAIDEFRDVREPSVPKAPTNQADEVAKKRRQRRGENPSEGSA